MHKFDGLYGSYSFKKIYYVIFILSDFKLDIAQV